MRGFLDKDERGEREEIYCLCDFYGFMIRGRIASVGATTSMNGYLAAIDDTVFA